MHLRIFAVGIFAARSLVACDCIGPPVQVELGFAAAVFTGKVVEKKELSKPRDKRQKYEVRFSVDKQWKGPRSSEIVVYDAQPIGDCQGLGFQPGKEYVVFVRMRAVTGAIKTRIGGERVVFHDMWSDVLPVGTKILVGETCSHTSEITEARARETLALLGKAP